MGKGWIPIRRKIFVILYLKISFSLKLKVNFEYNLKGGNLIISVQPFISMGGERGSKGF